MVIVEAGSSTGWMPFLLPSKQQQSNEGYDAKLFTKHW